MKNDGHNNTALPKELDHRSDGIPGAVVIGGDYQGLGIVRSLGRRGIPVCIVDDELSISQFSRYAKVGVRVPNLRNPGAVARTLLELGERLNLKGYVLFPTREELVSEISQHRAALSEMFRVPTPQWDTVRWAWDKRNTYCLAKELDIPIPETWFPTSQEDLNQITTSFPLVLKPAIKEHFFYATKAKAWRANNKAELQQLYLKASAVAGAGEILIQEMIPGNGCHQFGYCAFFKNGETVGYMVTQRRRQHPHDFGRASTYVETVDVPEIEKLSQKFLRKIDYYGLVEVEFKHDPRDGKFKLLDVNARTWGYHTLGALAGVDFVFLLYLDQIGKAVEPCRGRPGVSWIRLLTDFPTGIADIGSGRIDLREYWNSLRDFHTEAVFSRDDPIPGVMECVLLPYLSFKKGY